MDSYFREANIIVPLLHRPTFDRCIQSKLHLQDDGFARVLLAVCATGSQFIDDRRVFHDGQSGRSAGWKYYQQIQTARSPLLAPASLYDVQVYCVRVDLVLRPHAEQTQISVLFLHGSSAPQVCWSIIGVGIRLAQDAGAHRRKVYGKVPNTYTELWKRAFW